QAKPAQHAHAVGVQGNPGADRRPGGAALHQLGRESLPVQRGRQTEAADAPANHQNPVDCSQHVAPLLRLLQDRRP
ncbi:MAG TPA: hypothetical protein VGA45_01660, partial [Actinomycetota bacterium]